MIQHATNIRPTTENPLAIAEIPLRFAEVEVAIADLSTAASTLLARLGPVLGNPSAKTGCDTASIKAADSTEYGQALSKINDSVKSIHANLAEALDRLEV